MKKWKSLSHVQPFATSWTLQSMEFSARILEWVAFPCCRAPSNPGFEPRSPTLHTDFLPAEPQGKPEFIRTRDQIANIRRIMEKAREFQKNIYFCFIDYAKAFDCVGHNKLWKILQDMRIPDHRICLLRNLYAGQEATVRTGHGTTDWFQIGKGVCQGCIL